MGQFRRRGKIGVDSHKQQKKEGGGKEILNTKSKENNRLGGIGGDGVELTSGRGGGEKREQLRKMRLFCKGAKKKRTLQKATPRIGGHITEASREAQGRI